MTASHISRGDLGTFEGRAQGPASKGCGTVPMAMAWEKLR